MLNREFEWFKKNHKELFKQYPNKYIVIQDEKIIGAYDSSEQAYFETIKKYELGTFLIQLCSEGEEGYTSTFHSRVQFA